jgi:hypothetical protein
MTINVSEAATGRLLLTLDAPDDPNPALAFSPDSRSLLVGQYKSRSQNGLSCRNLGPGNHDQTPRPRRAERARSASSAGRPTEPSPSRTAHGQLRWWSGMRPPAKNGSNPASRCRTLCKPVFRPMERCWPPSTRGGKWCCGPLPMENVSPATLGRNRTMSCSPFRPMAAIWPSIRRTNSMKLWNLQTGRPALELPCGQAYFDRICFSNDSRLLLGSAPGSNTAWDVRTGKKMVEGAERAFDFDPQNNVFAQNRSGNVVFREAFSRQEKARLRGLGYGQGQFLAGWQTFCRYREYRHYGTKATKRRIAQLTRRTTGITKSAYSTLDPGYHSW